MMSGVPVETCWAFNKLWNNKFYYKLHLVGISTNSGDLSCAFLIAKLSGFFIMHSAYSASWRVMKQNYQTAVTRSWSCRYVGCVLPRREACTEQCRVLTIQTLCSTHKLVATAAKANKLLCRQCSLKLRSPASKTKARIFTVKRCVQNIAVFLCS
jgi:hypothetical protein